MAVTGGADPDPDPDPAGSLFSVPILQDDGIKMASFLSSTEIVPLYNMGQYFLDRRYNPFNANKE